MGSLSRAVTYDRDERGIAYGARALWRHRPRSSRASNAAPGRTGRPSAGRRGPGDWISNDREACEMQNAETVLGVLRERGRRGLPCEELYRQLFNPHLFLMAHGRIYANHGAMTPGACGETADGMSLAKIGRIIDALRHERYRFQPVKRVYIPKKSGAMRPLGLPSWSDKLVGEVMRLLLEAYYEPTFSGRSYGFRPGRGCHTALIDIAVSWTGSTWFIEGDISDCLDPWSYCSFCSLWWSEQPVLEGWGFDTQAFPASGADVDGAELSVFDTLHDGLAGDAVGEGGLQHG